MKIDSPAGPFKRLGDFTLADLESVRLILGGRSVIDWRRLSFAAAAEARAYVQAQGFDLDSATDRARIEAIRDQAVDYLRRQFDFPIPRDQEDADVIELMLAAGAKGHKQLSACSILKAMHIIHHVEARELLFALPMSSQDVFRLIEGRIYRLVGHMLSAGLPITEFVGGRKHRDSVYTKLLSKPEAHASAIYDKLRFRIVTRTKEDILPVLLYLSQYLFPANYVVPNESINTIFHFRSYCKSHPHLKALVRRSQHPLDDDFSPSDNRFSDENYRIIHYVVDLPVRVPNDVLMAAPEHARHLGSIVFGLCEFQMVDQVTEESNEQGEASHARYKERQRAAVMDRLKLGHSGRKKPS